MSRLYLQTTSLILQLEKNVKKWLGGGLSYSKAYYDNMLVESTCFTDEGHNSQLEYISININGSTGTK